MKVEPPGPADIESVEALLVESGLPLEGAADAIAGGVIGREGGRVVAAAGLERYGDAGLLRSVVVAPHHRGAGLGRAVVAGVEAIARQQGIHQLYVLTETAVDWFPRLGYEPVTRQEAEAAVGASVEFTTVCRDRGVAMRRGLAET